MGLTTHNFGTTKNAEKAKKMGRNNGTPFHPREDIMLLKLINIEGTAWKRIKTELKKNGISRSINSLRNRFSRIEKGRRFAASNNICSYCKQPKLGHVCYARLQDEALDDVEGDDDVDEKDVEEDDIKEEEEEDVLFLSDAEKSKIIAASDGSKSFTNIRFFDSIDMLGQSLDEIHRRRAHADVVDILGKMFSPNF